MTQIIYLLLPTFRVFVKELTITYHQIQFKLRDPRVRMKSNNFVFVKCRKT